MPINALFPPARLLRLQGFLGLRVPVGRNLRRTRMLLGPARCPRHQSPVPRRHAMWEIHGVQYSKCSCRAHAVRHVTLHPPAAGKSARLRKSRACTIPRTESRTVNAGWNSMNNSRPRFPTEIVQSACAAFRKESVRDGSEPVAAAAGTSCYRCGPMDLAQGKRGIAVDRSVDSYGVFGGLEGGIAFGSRNLLI